MKGKYSIRDKDSVEQDDEQDAVGTDVELQASVELQTQAKFDSDVRERVAAAAEHGRPHGMTLAAQEKWEAREMEKRRTRERADRDPASRREELCREMTRAKHLWTVQRGRSP